MIERTTLNLFDCADGFPTDWFFVYRQMVPDDTLWNRTLHRLLKPGYQHVFALRRDGAWWVVVNTHTECIDVSVMRSDKTPWQLFPGTQIQLVESIHSTGRLASPFHVGPWTCVETCKALAGIRSPFIRTPWQLYQRIRSKSREVTKSAKADRG
jgi:hypothetical protein